MSAYGQKQTLAVNAIKPEEAVPGFHSALKQDAKERVPTKPCGLRER